MKHLMSSASLRQGDVQGAPDEPRRVLGLSCSLQIETRLWKVQADFSSAYKGEFHRSAGVILKPPHPGVKTNHPSNSTERPCSAFPSSSCGRCLAPP